MACHLVLTTDRPSQQVCDITVTATLVSLPSQARRLRLEFSMKKTLVHKGARSTRRQAVHSAAEQAAYRRRVEAFGLPALLAPYTVGRSPR